MSVQMEANKAYNWFKGIVSSNPRISGTIAGGVAGGFIGGDEHRVRDAAIGAGLGFGAGHVRHLGGVGPASERLNANYNRAKKWVSETWASAKKPWMAE